jgi:putative hydrolase of the HAD superfamily
MKQLLERVKYIAFDADDTLWVNEPYFREAEVEYCRVLGRFAQPQEIIGTLYQTELKNLAPYGYGVKAFTLSLMETAIGFSNRGEQEGIKPLTPPEMAEVIRIGTSLINVPMEVLPGVKHLLEKLQERGKYQLIVATKGDLLDQNRKLQRSGLAGHFNQVEVMYDKNEETYLSLLKKLECRPEEFLMIGNSMKSDVLPVLNIGGYAVYIPFHSTWEHEKVEGEVVHPNLRSCGSCEDLLDIF